MRELAKLKKACEDMLRLYADLANSGDAGSWDPEKMPEVVKARVAPGEMESHRENVFRTEAGNADGQHIGGMRTGTSRQHSVSQRERSDC